ncbi:MAG: phosphatase [Clostridia bacterium]|nr:phosphatase [Clostridia bacterium]
MSKELSAVAADFHTHTSASAHAYSTLYENLTVARQRGLLAVAMTDHGIAIPDSPHIWHFRNQKCLPKQVEGVRLLRGVEANVLDDHGLIDMPADTLDMLDIVVASMHTETMHPGDREYMTAAWLAVAANPLVDIIGHCGTDKYAFDYERVIPEFGRCGKVVEINESSFSCRAPSIPHCRTILQLCKKHGVRVTLDSDAHFCTAVGAVPRSLQLLREEDFPTELVVNAGREQLDAYFSEKGIEW